MVASFPDSIKRFDRVINLVSDISEENVNTIYDEVEAISETIGVNIQGSRSSLNERLATSLDAAGNLRSDAIGSAALQDNIVTDAKIFNPDTFNFNSINVGRHGSLDVYGYTQGVGPEQVTSGVTIDASGNVFINGNLTVEGESSVLNLLSGTQTNLITENLSVSGNIYLGNEEDVDVLTVKGNQTIATNKSNISLEVTQQGSGDLFVLNSPSTELLRLTNNGQLDFKPETGGDSNYSGLNVKNTSSNNIVSTHYNTDESGRIDLFANDGSSNILTINTDMNEDEVFIGTQTDTNLRFKTNNTDRVYIDGTNGYVGINTTTPLAELHVDGDFIVNGNTILNSTQAVTGDLLVDGNVVLGNNLTDTVEISGTVDILGNTYIDDDLNVTGSADIDTDLNVDGNTVIDGTTLMSSHVTIDDSMTITGNQYTSGDVNINGSIDVDTDLNVDGNTVIDGTALISSYTTIDDSMTVTGSQHVSGNVNVNGSVDVDTNLNVDGNVVVDGTTLMSSHVTIDDSMTITGSQYTSGNTVINGSVDVDTSLNVDGITNIEGYTTINDSLEVTGTQYVSGDVNINGSVDISTDLNVDGNSVIDGTTIISGQTNIDDNLIVTGTQDLSGDLHASSNADIDGNLNVDGTLIADGLSTFNQSSTAIHSIGDIVGDKSLYIKNASIRDNLIVEDDGFINGNTVMGGTATINGETNINDDFVVTGTQDLSGKLSVNNSVDISNDLSIGGNFDIQGQVTINDDLVVTGTQDLSGDLNANGSINIGTDLVVDGNSTLGNQTSDQVNITGTVSLTDSGGTLSDIQTDIETNNAHRLTITGNPHQISLQDATTEGAVTSNAVTFTNSGTAIHTTGDIVVDDDLNVGSNFKANGNEIIIGNSNIGGNGFVSGNFEVNQQLDVNVNAVIDGNLAIGIASTSGNRMYVNGDTVVNGDLTVTGTEIVANTEAVSGDQLITGNLDVNGVTILRGNMTFGDPEDEDSISFKGTNMTFHNDILSSDGTERIGSTTTPFDLIYVDEMDLGINRITDGNLFGNWNFQNSTLSNINTATIATGNITTANLGVIDLGTNTIDDGVFTGNWNFSNSTLSNINTATIATLNSTVGNITTIDSTNGYFSSKVGVGTNNPAQTLGVHGNVNFNTTNGNGNEARFLFNVGGSSDPAILNMYQGDGTTVGARINANGDSYVLGNIGIGTSSPNTDVHVQSSADGGISLYRLTTLSAALSFAGTNDEGILTLYDNGAANPRVRLHANGTNYIVNGNLGIGTNNPELKFHVSNEATDVLRITNKTATAGNDVAFSFQSRRPANDFASAARIVAGFSETSDNNNSFLGFETRIGGLVDQRTMTIRNGEVGIGTDDPSSKLHVNGALLTNGSITTTNNDIVMGTGDLSGDQVTITGRIHAAANTNISSQLGRAAIGYVGHDDWAGFAHIDTNNTTDYALIQDTNGTTLLNAATSESIGFRINNVELMNFNSSRFDIDIPLETKSIDTGSNNINMGSGILFASKIDIDNIDIDGNTISNPNASLELTSAAGLVFHSDTNNDDTSSDFVWITDLSTELMRLTDSGSLSILSSLSCTSINTNNNNITMGTGDIYGNSANLSSLSSATISGGKLDIDNIDIDGSTVSNPAGNLILSSVSDIHFIMDSDNNSITTNFRWYKDPSTQLMNLNDSGDLTLTIGDVFASTFSGSTLSVSNGGVSTSSGGSVNTTAFNITNSNSGTGFTNTALNILALNNTNNTGIYVDSRSKDDASGTTYGIFSKALKTASASMDFSEMYGGYFLSQINNGTSVSGGSIYGLYSEVNNDETTGGITNGYGLYAKIFSGGVINNQYAIYADRGANSNWAGYFNGNISVQGSITTNGTGENTFNQNTRVTDSGSALNVRFIVENTEPTTDSQIKLEAQGSALGGDATINMTGTGTFAIGSSTNSNLALYRNGSVFLTMEDSVSKKFRIADDVELWSKQVYTNNVSSAQLVYVKSDGEIGFQPSSIRYKENVNDLKNSEKIYDLRPVNFNYKDENLEDIQVGLIAEEVINHIPEIVPLDGEGLPATVNYISLIPFLIKEIQNLKKEIDDLKNK